MWLQTDVVLFDKQTNVKL